MIERHLKDEFLQQLQEYPIVTVLGPRQSGKTTLVKSALPNYQYVNLELPDIRQFALEDPKAFLKKYSSYIIFDEIQRVPHLLSYLQGIVDNLEDTAQFVLTGSHQLQLREAITQSLAGRTAILHLLPLSISEMTQANIGFKGFNDYIFQGFMPRIYDKNQRPHIAYANYYQTYIERDVRQLIHLKDATLFEKFMKLLAGRVGQLINYQSLSNDVGVDAKTIKQWLSILEASFVVFKLLPYFENFGKRVIKAPKYYFIDTGLLSYLLDIEKSDQVIRDPLVGSLFENLIVIEALKQRFNRGLKSNLYFFRNSQGKEIDLLLKSGSELVGVEIKSAATWSRHFTKNLKYFSKTYQNLTHEYVVYSGENISFSDGLQAIEYKNIGTIIP